VATLEERFRGCLLGLALGDALGAPYEFYRPEEIPTGDRLVGRFGRVMDLPVGTVTDDTQMAVALARSLVERGRLDGEDVAWQFARLWQQGTVIGPGLACSVAVGRFLGGVDWHKAGCGEGRAGNGAAMRVAPVGLLRFRTPAALVEDARTQSIVTHTDPRAVAGAVVVARAVAWCVEGEHVDAQEFVEELARAADIDCPEFGEYIRKLPQWLDAPEEEAVAEIARAGQPTFTDRVITPFVVPTVLAGLYTFLRSPRDFGQSVGRVIRMGGDTDTTAAITGALSGSLNGEAALPQHLLPRLREGRHRPNLVEELRHVADQLHRLATQT